MQTPIFEPSTAAATAHSSAELEVNFDRLQHETLDCVLVSVFAGGIVLLGLTPQFYDPIWSVTLGIGLILTASLGGALRKRYLELTGGLLVCAYMVAIFTMVFGAYIPEALYLLALPVGLAGMFYGARYGAILAALCTLGLLLTPLNVLSISLEGEIMTLIVMWGILGILYLAMRPLIATAKWAWSAHQLSEDLLERSHATQLQNCARRWKT